MLQLRKARPLYLQLLIITRSNNFDVSNAIFIEPPFCQNSKKVYIQCGNCAPISNFDQRE